jgi:hypothetical protein
LDRICRKVFWTELTEFIELGLDRRGRRVFLDRMTGFAGDYRMGRKGFFDRINRINRIGFWGFSSVFSVSSVVNIDRAVFWQRGGLFVWFVCIS